MRNGERDFAPRKLDKELAFYRLAGKEKHPTQELCGGCGRCWEFRWRRWRGSWG